MNRTLFACLTGLLLAGAALADDPGPVLDWNALMLAAIRLENSGPTLGSRNLAILHTSIYDAVNSVTRTHQPYRYLRTTPPDTSAPAAAVGAAYEIVSALYPSMQAQADDLFETFLASQTATPALTNGLALGQSIAQHILDWRSADGAATSVPYIPSDAPGQWRRTPPYFRPPLDPQWRYLTPFCLPNIQPFVPTNLPALTGPEWAAAFNEVKAIGSLHSTNRTAEQSQIAVFWSDFSYTAMPPGHWHEIAATIVRNQQTSFADAVRLLALISLAQADGAIVCWEAKYRFNAWRPVTAIQRGDEDGNPATDADPNWAQFLPSPPFPEYPSGHSTFSKASAEILAAFYGSDALSFTANSDSLPGVTRRFTSLAACADEVGMSRIYGGFHFQFSNRDGKRTGQKVGQYVARNFLLANADLPFVRVDGVQNGAVQLVVHGQIGTVCTVEASTDLIHWQTISTSPAAIGGVFVTDTVLLSTVCKFYRVR